MKKQLLFYALLALVNVVSATDGEARRIPKKRHHVLLTDWKEGTTVEEVAQLEAMVRTMSKEIPGFDKVVIRELTNSPFNHQMTLVFTNKEALEAYENHLLHQKMKELAPRLVQAFEAYDFWE